MASSIRAGALPGSCTGVLLVRPTRRPSPRKTCAGWRQPGAGSPEYIVAAQYGATLGAPAVFPASSFRDLAALRGDRGAQSLFKRNPDRVIRVPMDSASIDIDTPEDLLRLDPTKR
jgi:CTP:molybdopterin cytidylyltransferase MocA